jgi:hypothetical protein
MFSVEEYRQRAQDCLEKATHATGPNEKAKWQELADAWLRLANGEHVVVPIDASKPSVS